MLIIIFWNLTNWMVKKIEKDKNELFLSWIVEKAFRFISYLNKEWINLYCICTFKDKEGRKDKIVQGGDDDRELLSVSLTQSEQLYVYTSYQSFSSPFSFFSLFVCSKIVLVVICVCRVLYIVAHIHLWWTIYPIFL